MSKLEFDINDDQCSKGHDIVITCADCYRERLAEKDKEIERLSKICKEFRNWQKIDYKKLEIALDALDVLTWDNQGGKTICKMEEIARQALENIKHFGGNDA